MADGINAAEITGAINDNGANIVNSLNTNANAEAKSMGEIQGVTERVREKEQQILDAVNALTDPIKNLLQQVSTVVDNLTTIKTITQQEHTAALKMTADEKAHTDPSEKKPDAGKVQQLPAAYGTPALFLGNKLDDIFGEKGQFFRGSMEKIIQLLQNAKGEGGGGDGLQVGGILIVAGDGSRDKERYIKNFVSIVNSLKISEGLDLGKLAKMGDDLNAFLTTLKAEGGAPDMTGVDERLLLVSKDVKIITNIFNSLRMGADIDLTSITDASIDLNVMLSMIKSAVNAFDGTTDKLVSFQDNLALIVDTFTLMKDADGVDLSGLATMATDLNAFVREVKKGLKLFADSEEDLNAFSKNMAVINKMFNQFDIPVKDISQLPKMATDLTKFVKIMSSGMIASPDFDKQMKSTLKNIPILNDIFNSLNISQDADPSLLIPMARGLKDFIKELQPIFDEKNEFTITKKQAESFKLLADALASIVNAAQVMAKSGGTFIIASTVALPFAQMFLKSAFALMNTITDPKKIDLLAKVSKAVAIAIQELTKAAIFAQLILFVILPAKLGLLLLRGFLQSAIELSDIVKDVKTDANSSLGKLGVVAEELKSSFKNLLATMFYAAAMMLVGAMAIVGVVLIKIFLKSITNLLDNVDFESLEKNIDKMTHLSVKLISLFRNLLIAMVFTALAGILAIVATIALLGVIVFLLGVALVGLIAGLLSTPIATFTSTILLIAATMVLFALTMILIQMIVPKNMLTNVMNLIVGIGILLIAFAILGLLGFLVSFAIAGITVAAILLLVAVAALFVVFLLLDKFPSLDKALERIKVIGQFFMILASYWLEFLVGLLVAALLAVASILLLIGIALLFLAVLLLEFVANAIVRLMKLKFEGTPDGMPGVFGVLALFFLAFIMLIPVLIPALIASVLLAVVAVLLFVSILLLTITVGLLNGLIAIMPDAGTLLGLTGQFIGFFLFITVIGALSLLVIVAAVPLLVAAVLLLAVFTALTVTFALVAAVAGISGKIDVKGVQDKILELYKIINFRLIAASIVVTIAAVPVLAAAVMMLAIFASIAGAYVAIKKLEEIQQDAPDPQVVFNAVARLADLIKDVSDRTKGSSIIALAAFKIGMGAVIEAIAMIVDTIIKINREFGGDNGKTLIENATKNLNYVVAQMFGIDMPGAAAGEGGLIKVFDKIKKGMSKDQLRAAEALVPITEAIDNIADVVIKMNNLGNIDQGIANTKKLAEFVGELIVLASGFTSEPKGILSGIGASLFGKGSTADQIKAASETVALLPDLMDQLVNLNDSVNGIQGLDAAAQNVIDMSKFVLQLVDFAGTFQKGGWFSGGGTEEEIRTAIGVLRAITPMVTELQVVNSKVGMINDVGGAVTKVKLLIPFVKDIAQIAIDLSASSNQMGKAVDASRTLVTVSTELMKVANNVQAMEQMRINLENNIIQPLLSLDEPANRLAKVRTEVTRLNSELSKLAKDNKETLKGIASIGNTSAGALSGFIMKLSTVFKKNGANEKGASDTGEDPMVTIQKDVHGIADFLINNNKSWTAT
jgi:hypothetical protein